VINISQRAKNFPFSPIRKLMPLAEQAKKKGIKIYHLNIGQPDIQSPKIFLDKLKNYNEKVVAYDRSEGREEFLESFCRYYRKNKISLKTQNMIATYGGSEALFMAFCILFDKDDECLTIEPFYTNYLTIAQSCDVKLKTVTTALENNFQLPPIKEIKKAVGPKTKAVLICNPNNPTGALYPEKVLKELIDFCCQKNIFIISDDAYRDFVYDGKKIISLLSFKKAKDIVVVCDTLSKRYSLCGARLGAIISRNEKVIKSALKIAQSRTSISSILQSAASCLDQVPKNYFSKILKEYQSRRNTLIAGLKKIPGVKFGHPQGAFYLIAELPVKNSEDFCRFLLNDFNYKGETVMLSPAKGFYLTPGLGKNQVRIAYVLNCNDIKKSCLILKKALQKYTINSK
jgi:aspartate aminotransferase